MFTGDCVITITTIDTIVAYASFNFIVTFSTADSVISIVSFD
jgi:hypothetical protein